MFYHSDEHAEMKQIFVIKVIPNVKYLNNDNLKCLHQIIVAPKVVYPIPYFLFVDYLNI